MPEWLRKVIECAMHSTGSIALTSIKTFLEILSAEEAEDDPISPLRHLQSLIIREGTTQAIDTSLTLYEILQQTGNLTCKAIIKNLWQQLDKEEDHSIIVSLLKDFDGYLPALFSEVVIKELNSEQKEVKVRAINKFNIFWKITSKDYPDYIPFREKDKNNKNRRYMALHTILQILEDYDPSLRLTCKTWLNDSRESFRRILDPLMEEFLENSNVYVSLGG